MTVAELKNILNLLPENAEVVIVHADWEIKHVELEDEHNRVKIR